MAELPKNATLLFNPINNMSGFALEDRYFFVPGFPSMAHPMIADAISKHFCHSVKKYRKTLLAQTSEERLTTLMQQLPQEIELSSLPMFVDGRPNVELSLRGEDLAEIERCFALFVDELDKKEIAYKLIEG
jgi:molybdopterin-biosynthesis enzyme MoeA-like protein